MLKALLSDSGAAFHKTHELGALMDILARSGTPLPDEFENPDVLTARTEARAIAVTPDHFEDNVNQDAA